MNKRSDYKKLQIFAEGIGEKLYLLKNSVTEINSDKISLEIEKRSNDKYFLSNIFVFYDNHYEGTIFIEGYEKIIDNNKSFYLSKLCEDRDSVIRMKKDKNKLIKYLPEMFEMIINYEIKE
jgi:hypothetical protein